MKKMLLSVLLFAASAITAQAQGFRVYRSDGAVYEFSFAADSIVFFDGAGDPNYEEPIPSYVRRAIEELQSYCANNAAAIQQTRADVMTTMYNNIQEVATELKSYADELGNTLNLSIAELRNMVEMNTERYQQLKETVAMLAKDNQDTNHKVSELQNMVRVAIDEIAENTVAIHSVQNNVDALIHRVGQIEDALNDLTSRVTAIQTFLEELRQDVALNSADIGQLMTKIRQDEDTISRMQQTSNGLSYRIENLESDANAKDAVIAELLGRISRLEAQLNQ